MSDLTFEEQVAQALRNKILKQISTVDFVRMEYNERIQIPKNTLDEIFGSIKWDEVIEQIRPEIQKRICNAIVGNMETELKTDIKKLMAVEGVRERLRMEVYPYLMRALDKADINS